MCATEIEWRPVLGTGAKYEISSTGDLRSYSQKCRAGRILKKQVNSYGYAHYTIMREDGSMFTRTAHRLVLEAFVGPKPDGCECRHLDGNKLNNNIDNLRWGTHEENTKDRARHGRDRKGSKHHKAKITELDVTVIRSRAGEPGANISAIGRDYGLSPATTHKIVRRELWSHVQ